MAELSFFVCIFTWTMIQSGIKLIKIDIITISV